VHVVRRIHCGQEFVRVVIQLGGLTVLMIFPELLMIVIVSWMGIFAVFDIALNLCQP